MNQNVIQEAPPVITEKVLLKINLPATRLDFYVNDQLVKSYSIAIGMPKYPTPIRQFNMSQIIWNPWWIPPPDSEWAKDEVETPPGPRNPLGPVKMLLEDGVRIHGTSAPRSIGRAASHACMRMRSEEARELAWEIQKRYSEKKDPELFEKYKKNQRSSYYVQLLEKVPVYVVYEQIEKQGEKLLLHPNRYWRGGFDKQIKEFLLASLDIREDEIDKDLIRHLDKLRRNKTAEISFSEVFARVQEKRLQEQSVAPFPGSMTQQQK